VSKQVQDKPEPECAARIAVADFLRSDVGSVDLRANLVRSRSRHARRREAECVLLPALYLIDARRRRRTYQADHASRQFASTRAENPAATGRIPLDDRS